MTPAKEKGAQSARLAVEYVPIDSIKPSPRNTRTHPPEQITQIATSIEKNGWTKPIIVDDKGEILAGHGAHMAAQQLGHTEVPIIRRAGLTAAQKRAYRIADNKIGEGSGWDTKLLGAEFLDLAKMGFDVTLTGFSQTEVDFILRPPAKNTAEPPTQDPKGPAISRQGDLWLLGDHRLIVGDSTKPATFKRLMNGQTAQCVFTDPPYGVSYQGLGLDSSKVEVIKGDNERRGKLKEMLVAAFSAAIKHVRDDSAWYIWHGDKTRMDFAEAIRDVGLVELGMIIWDKGTPTMGWTDYRFGHEPCFYAALQGSKPAFHGDRANTTVWRLQHSVDGQGSAIGNGIILTTKDGQELFLSTAAPKGKKVRHLHINADEAVLLQPSSDTGSVWIVGKHQPKQEAIHPTMKPVELVRKALKNSTLEGQIVLDMFSGSGSTIMGAEQTQRVGYAVELDPLYADASIRRWQTMTGKAATHAEEKTTFDAIAKSRKP